MTKKTCRVRIQWTETAKHGLRKIPLDARRGLLEKADDLIEFGGDPREVCKRLTGPLRGYFRIKYSRYRAIFRVEEEVSSGGEVQLKLLVIFVAAGIRRERSKQDVYEVAKKLVELVDDVDNIDESKAKPRRDRRKRRD